MKWISVKEKLPKHHKTVLAYTPKGQCVCIFIDTTAMNKVLVQRGFKAKPDNNLYDFCSQEIAGNVLNGVSHWMPLPEPPK